MSDEWKNKSRDLIAQLTEGKFAEVHAGCSSEMAGAISVQQLDDMWSGLLGQAGAFKSFVENHYKEIDGYHTTLNLIELERGKLVVRLVYDSAGALAGLHFQPAPPDDPAS